MARLSRARLAGAAWVLALVVAPGSGAGAEASGALSGQVSLSVEGLTLEAVAPVVVFLDPLGPEIAVPAPSARALLRQRRARFDPPFLVVQAGQRISMPNEDPIYHNVFSYSKPNDFDLGLYPAGETRTVTLRHPGVVKTYCSIHESMNATILVSPTPWFAVVGGDGAYRIEGVPPGRYRAVAWSEALPRIEREIEVAPGRTTSADWALGG